MDSHETLNELLDLNGVKHSCCWSISLTVLTKLNCECVWSFLQALTVDLTGKVAFIAGGLSESPFHVPAAKTSNRERYIMSPSWELSAKSRTPQFVHWWLFDSPLESTCNANLWKLNDHLLDWLMNLIPLIYTCPNSSPSQRMSMDSKVPIPASNLWCPPQSYPI